MENSMTHLRSVTCHMGSHSHSVTCYPTQVNTPRLHPSQTGWYSIHRPFKHGGLSKPRPRVQRATGPRLLCDSPRDSNPDLEIVSRARQPLGYRVMAVYAAMPPLGMLNDYRIFDYRITCRKAIWQTYEPQLSPSQQKHLALVMGIKSFLFPGVVLGLGEKPPFSYPLGFPLHYL